MEHETTEALAHTSMLSDPKFWVAASFVLFFALFGKKLYKAMVRALDNRSARIRAELEEAHKLRQEAEATLAAYKKKYQESMKEAEAILARARQDADRMAQAAQAELARMLETRKRMAEDKITQAETQAIEQVQHHVVDITISAAKALIMENISQVPSDELLSRAVADLGRKVH